MTVRAKFVNVGVISVDAGLCWIGDPCYILHNDDGKPRDPIGKSWDEFCDKLGSANATAFEHNPGNPGLGVCVRTGHGDGFYPVQARLVDGQVAEVRIVFID